MKVKTETLTGRALDYAVVLAAGGKLMKSIEDIYVNRDRGPWTMPTWLDEIAGDRERTILAQRDTESYPHRFNKDTDFYMGDDCITYYNPTHGSFTIRFRQEIVG